MFVEVVAQRITLYLFLTTLETNIQSLVTAEALNEHLL